MNLANGKLNYNRNLQNNIFTFSVVQMWRHNGTFNR